MRPIRRHPSQDLAARRAEALTRSCPPAPRGCGAARGIPCRNLVTGEELTRQAAHPARLHPPTPALPLVPELREPDVRELASSSHR